MKKEKISYVDAPKDIADSLKNAKQITDFLPPPEELILKEPKVKVTIVLSSRSVDFFKKHAEKNKTKYQTMIYEVLDRYAQNYNN
ncbi:MAG: BrnA antitoxin family protein [Spirochaetaceae bacterium]|nr:BrnA antitoxin family protein [Spirochaetaceae bacterium]